MMQLNSASFLFYIAINFLTVSLIDGGNAFKSYVKEPLEKDGYNTGKQISSILGKLEVVESKMDTFQQSLRELNNEIEENAEILKKLEVAVMPDESFWNQSYTCGGVIVAQTGKIQPSGYSSDIQDCLWTIRVNYRSRIKLSFHRDSGTNTNRYSTNSMSRCQIIEIKFGENGPGGPQSLQLSQIYPQSTYMFEGPMVFLTCNVYHSRYSTYGDSYLTFEGLGPEVYTDIVFQNLHFVTSKGSVNSTEFNDTEINSLQSKKKLVYTTITTSNANVVDSTLKLSVQKMFANDSDSSAKCEPNQSLEIFDFGSIIADNFTTYNCCEIECQQMKKMWVKYGKFLATSSSSIPSSKNFQFQWEHLEHSSPPSGYCGGIISGRTSGTITRSSYQNNDRCIWLIHLSPKTEIMLQASHYGTESGHDYLVAVEIDKDEPTTTTLENYGSYNLSGRAIAIMFYSDNTIRGGSITITWRVAGSTDKNLQASDDRLFRLTKQQGDLYANDTNIQTSLSRRGLHVFVINPQNIDTNSLNLSLQLNVQGKANLKVLGSKNASFTSLFQSEGSVPIPNLIRSWDGVFIILLEVHDDSTSIDSALSWEPGPSTLPTQYSACGGTMHGTNGIINYHAGTTYPLYERCTWILHSPLSSVEFKLQKSSISCCQDMLSFDVIDPDQGTIWFGKTVHMRSKDENITVQGPLIIITFQSNAPNNGYGKGFVLEFNSFGDPVDSNHKFRIIHKNEKQDDISYPFLDEEPLEDNELLILGLSNANIENNGNGASIEKMSVQISFSFEEVHETTIDTEKLNVYSYLKNGTFQPSLECSFSTGNIEEECETFTPLNENYGMGNATSGFQNSLNTIDLKVNYTAFLLIYKPKSSTSSLGFNISWEENSACGGIIYGNSGTIEYKYLQPYKHNEFCIWIIQASDKISLTFNLYSSGLEACCDHLSITPLYDYDGTLGSPHRLMYSDVTVSSSVAFLVFKSDGSINGNGFRIYYSSSPRQTVSENNYLYRHIYSKKYGALSIPSNTQHLMRPNEIVTLTFIPKRSIDMIYPTSFMIFKELNLYVNENCSSDSLRFYLRTNLDGNFGYMLQKSFRSYAEEGDGIICNHTTVQNDYDYETPTPTVCQPECYNTNALKQIPGQKFAFNVPFIAIYKSIAGQNSDQKGIQFEWKNSLDVVEDENVSAANDSMTEY